MHPETFTGYVAVALAMAVMAGPIAAGLVQLVKIIWTMLAKGKPPGSDTQAIMGAVCGAAITAVMVWRAGVPLEFAIAATIVALFSPKLAYDAAKSLHQTAKNDSGPTPKPDNEGGT